MVYYISDTWDELPRAIHVFSLINQDGQTEQVVYKVSIYGKISSNEKDA